MAVANDRDEILRAACKPSLTLRKATHPDKPDWMALEGKPTEVVSTSSIPKPVLIKYDSRGNTTNEPQVVTALEMSSTILRFTFDDTFESTNKWKHLVVIGLLTAFEQFAETCPVNDKTMEVVVHGPKVTLRSKVNWPSGSLVLVPKVPGVSYVTEKSLTEFEKNRMLIKLVRACDEGDRCHALAPAVKLPRKGVDPQSDPSKWLIVPAWLARRSTSTQECNMELQTIPIDEVLTIGAGKEDTVFAAAHSITVPVFVNSEDIAKGQEIVIYSEPTKSGAKKAKTQTWRNVMPIKKVK